jgi:sigma-B regulation protein RsbU (phosphoserine phosphatase)
LYTGPNKDTELARVFDRAKTLLVTEVSNFEYYAATNVPAVFIAAPVLQGGVAIGVVVLQMSNQEVYTVVNDYTGLGKTGETVVGSRGDHDVVFVTPLRHDPYAAFRRKVPLGSAIDVPLQQAAQGGQGYGMGTDYRAKQVMTAWKYLPSLRWAMVVKIDTDEAFAPIVKQRNAVFIVGSITLLLVVVGALLVARSISNPIVALTRAVRVIAGGNLQQAVPIVRHDEIGELGQAFNTMTADLQQSYATLEQRVEERTTQLAQAHAEISTLNQRLAADNLRMSAELGLVRQMQHLILPTPDELVAIDGLDIAAFMEPADEVGGDYYDVLHADGVVTIGIGDVTGHGLESGILMVMTQAAVRTLQAIREADPVRFLDTLNRMLYHNVRRMRSDKNLTFALLTYAQGQVRISGQHEEAIIVRHGGAIERIATIDLGFPLGLEADITAWIRHVSVALHPGDGVVLYTDGITEAADSHQRLYGIDRLCTVISQHWAGTAQDIQAAVMADVRCHIGAQKVYDDITLVVAKQR